MEVKNIVTREKTVTKNANSSQALPLKSYTLKVRSHNYITACIIHCASITLYYHIKST